MPDQVACHAPYKLSAIALQFVTGPETIRRFAPSIAERLPRITIMAGIVVMFVRDGVQIVEQSVARSRPIDSVAHSRFIEFARWTFDQRPDNQRDRKIA